MHAFDMSEILSFDTDLGSVRARRNPPPPSSATAGSVGEEHFGIGHMQAKSLMNLEVRMLSLPARLSTADAVTMPSRMPEGDALGARTLVPKGEGEGLGTHLLLRCPR